MTEREAADQATFVSHSLEPGSVRTQSSSSEDPLPGLSIVSHLCPISSHGQGLLISLNTRAIMEAPSPRPRANLGRDPPHRNWGGGNTNMPPTIGDKEPEGKTEGSKGERARGRGSSGDAGQQCAPATGRSPRAPTALPSGGGHSPRLASVGASPASPASAVQRS